MQDVNGTVDNSTQKHRRKHCHIHNRDNYYNSLVEDPNFVPEVETGYHLDRAVVTVRQGSIIYEEVYSECILIEQLSATEEMRKC